jgi:Holliday junction resolvase RusA-like endonuclease
MGAITFTVPGEPRPKKSHIHTRNGGRANPANQVNESEVQRYCVVAALAQRAAVPAFTGALYCIATFYMRKAKSNKDSLPLKRPDDDNMMKLIGDAMEGILYKNDSQIVAVHLVKVWAEAGQERTEIEVGEIAGLDRDDYLYKIEQASGHVFEAMETI